MTLLLSPCTPTSGSPPGIPSPQGYHWNLGPLRSIPISFFSLPPTFHHSTSSSQPELLPPPQLPVGILTIPYKYRLPARLIQSHNKLSAAAHCLQTAILPRGRPGSGHGRGNPHAPGAARHRGAWPWGCGLRLGHRGAGPEGKPRIL